MAIFSQIALAAGAVFVVPALMAVVSYNAAIFAAGALTGKVVRLVDLRCLEFIRAMVSC